MRAGWLNVVAVLVGVPLILTVLVGGAALLYFLIRLAGGWVGELVIAFVGLHVVCTVACFVAISYLERGSTPSRWALLGGLVIAPAILGVLLLVLIQWLATAERAAEMTRVAGSFGCFFVVVVLSQVAVNYYERRFSAQDSLTGLEDPLELPDPNDPNQRASL
jgi:hypothetical protein